MQKANVLAERKHNLSITRLLEGLERFLSQKEQWPIPSKLHEMPMGENGTFIAGKGHFTKWKPLF